MIKVGQIFRNKRGKEKFVITRMEEDDDDERTPHCDTINNKGNTSWRLAKYLEYNFTLLAEYPTWQEAVNSKEFKGE